MGVILDGNCPGGSYPAGWEFSRWELSVENQPGGSFPCVSFPIPIYLPWEFIFSFHMQLERNIEKHKKVIKRQ